jgi:serine/threonine protein kinase
MADGSGVPAGVPTEGVPTEGVPTEGIPKQEIVGRKRYYGDQRFIDECVAATNEKIMTTKSKMTGGYGKAYLIQVRGINYIVKYMMSPFKNESRIKHEIEIAFELTAKIPDAVSNIKGARYEIRTKQIDTYLIFEGPKGMDFMSLYESGIIKSYELIFKQIDASLAALHAIGYVHQDIKPENLYILLDDANEPIGCKLIDFDSVAPIGEKWRYFGTPLYLSPKYQEMISNFERTSVQLDSNKLPNVTPYQNIYAIETIKSMLLPGYPAPSEEPTESAAASATVNRKGGRRTRNKRLKHKRSKTRSKSS